MFDPQNMTKEEEEKLRNILKSAPLRGNYETRKRGIRIEQFKVDTDTFKFTVEGVPLTSSVCNYCMFGGGEGGDSVGKFCVFGGEAPCESFNREDGQSVVFLKAKTFKND